MQVCLIMAVSHQGCTAHIRDMFLERLTAQCPDAQVRQFVLPKDGPGFCLGCKQCFTKDISACPHHAVTGPIWQAMADSDLSVFIMPTYVFGVPAQLKALLKQALTDRIDDRAVYMKGIDVSYHYEGYSEFKTEEL